MAKVTLSKEEFNTFIDRINLDLIDLIIKNGEIRQFNDDKTVIINVFTGVDISMNLTINYLPMFKLFANSEQIEMEVTDDNMHIILSDEYGKIKLANLYDEKYLFAEFIPDEKFETISSAEVIDNIDNVESIKRIIKATKIATNSTIMLDVKNGKARFIVEAKSNASKIYSTPFQTNLHEQQYIVPEFKHIQKFVDDINEVLIRKIKDKDLYTLQFKGDYFNLYYVIFPSK